jgi:hypothetical protein
MVADQQSVRDDGEVPAHRAPQRQHMREGLRDPRAELAHRLAPGGACSASIGS